MEPWEQVEQVRYDPLYKTGYSGAGPHLLVEWSSVRLFDHPRFLDIGCGKGLLAAHANRTYIGLDVSAVAISKARKQHPNCVFHVGGTSKLKELLPLTCDVVICNDVMEHVPLDHLDDFMLTFLQVSGKPKFLLCISCREATTVDAAGEQVHRTVRSPQWWLDLLDRLGFHVVKMEYNIKKLNALFIEATAK